MPEEVRDDGGDWRRSARRFVTAALGLGAVVGVGVIVETKADGGFLKDVWEGLKTPSPAISMCLGIAIYVIWGQWQRDRKEHQHRTEVFTQTLNRYARILETAPGRKRRSRS